MSRHRGDWDDDFYAGEPRPRRRGDYGDERPVPPGERRGPPPPPPPPRYEYDERDRPRGGRPSGLRGDYDAYAQGRGDFYRDEYYTGRPPLPRREDDERGYERERPRRRGATRSHLRCRDIMTRDVTVAARDTTLEEVARMMRDEDTGVIPVVEPGETTSDSVTEVQRVPARTLSNGRLVGLITDRDIVIRAIAEGGDARSLRAEEVMTKDLHTVRPNDRVIEAIRKMGDRQVRRLPVVDREGALRGIISMADVALETEADRELAEALEEISSGSSFWNRIFS
ncbi:MAG TPA: CBS domain-containing protein [Pyrinomonadaceae bacterium]|nr:CBS domain-containing protein [Pyrinomonadaceae bacterium]